MIFNGPKTEEEISDFLKTRVESLSLPVKVENSLLRSSIRTIGGIIRKGNDGLYNVEGIGLRGVEEIIKSLSDCFDININDKNIKFTPKYYKVEDIIKEKTDEVSRLKNEIKEKELKDIERKYSEKQEEKDFLYNVKISSLDLDFEAETFILANGLITVGDLLSKKEENIKDKINVLDINTDLIFETFDYLTSKEQQIESEMEVFRKNAIDLVGYLPRNLENKKYYFDVAKNLNPRNLKIFDSFRKGMTLEQIGVENGITRERSRQIIASTLNKMDLDYENERKNIINKRRESRPQKIKKEKWWSREYKECISCGTTSFKHVKCGLCEKCAGHFSGENRDKIITEHNNKCDICGISREEARSTYGRDFYISKSLGVFCRGCHLVETGKKLSVYKIDKWKKFYK